ncbi:MAG TPA: polysaccharide biosynthesis/export family protein [Vicinamibacterales bacterium]|nr:polysaccharide biosynthesis/export family protein [Vicinamibacterales bacterium]
MTNVLLGAFIVTMATALFAAEQQPAATDYIIGPQDVLTITSFDQEDLSGKYPVDADGTFTFPLIGRVKAGGLTLRELETELKRLLKDGFFKDPQVAVGVDSYKSQKIHIVGEVRNPGTFALTGDMSLIEAIARAGSSLPNASGEILIVRAKAGQSTSGPVMPNGSETDVTTVDLKELQSGALRQSVALRDGDTIFVPRAETVYVFGQVKLPGAYPIQRNTTVLQALSLAGGVSERGATGRIKIVRLENGKTVEVRVKLSDIVRPGDTIMVPERFF